MFLVVRTKDRLKNTMLALKEQDFLSEALPISTMKYTQAKLPEGVELDAYIATSPQGVVTIPKNKYPVFCVGQKTAGEAQTMGLRVASVGTGGAEELAHQIVRRYPVQTFLHVTGDTADTSWYPILEEAGFKVHKSVGYTTTYIQELTPATVEKINSGAYKAILLYSAGGARVFGDLCAKFGVNMSKLSVVTLSQQVADQLQGFGQVFVAENPTEVAVIQCIQQNIPA